MDLKEILKHAGICTAASVAASIGVDNYIEKSSMSDENKRAVKGAVTGAAAGIPIGYLLGELANKGHKDYTAKEKIVSSAAGGLLMALAGYGISRAVEYNGKKMTADSSTLN